MANKLTTLAQLREAAAKAQGRIAAVALAAANAVQEVADNLASHTHSWGSITGKPDTFTPASHNHDRLVTEGDNRSTATAPNDYYNTLRFRGLKQNDAIGYPSGDNYSYLIGWRGWTDSSGGYSREIAANNSGIYTRIGESTSWGAWTKLLDSGNFKEAVTLASLGAAAEGHTHDGRYYTETEVDTLLTGKSGTGHTHDDRYYTESEVDTKLNSKSNTSHNHTNVVSLGNVTAETGTASQSIAGLSMQQAYSNGYPATYGNVLNLNGTGQGQILVSWAGNGATPASVMCFRGKTDNNKGDWSAWNTVYSTGNKPTKSDVGLGNVDNTADSEKSVKYAASAGGVAWGNVTDKPSTYTPASHTHTKSQITDFPTSMPASDVYAWAKQSTKPSYSKAEIGLGNVDNTADSAKSVNYAASAGSATSASNVGGFTFAASTTDLTAGSSALATNQVYFVYS